MKFETQLLNVGHEFRVSLYTINSCVTLLTEEEAKKLRDDLDLHLMDIQLSKQIAETSEGEKNGK